MKPHYRSLAHYNAWANNRLYDAVAALEEEAYRRDLGAFFGSVHGTLNHVLVADRVWMKRFTGEGDHPDRLDAIIHARFDDLREAREDEDARIIAYVEALDPAALEGTFTYTTMTDNSTITQRLAPALTHVFNHQTHHRGQAHGLLSQLRRTPPPLDLIYFYRAPEGAAFA